jgi:glycosyl hydrolase family 114
MTRGRAPFSVLVPMLALVLAGSAFTPSYAVSARVSATVTRTLPPTGTDWDYQLGGDRPVPAHVGIVERDRLSKPLKGKYNVCYVNGFQTQVEQKRFWHRHWSLVLKKGGRPVVDSVWGEWLLDTGTHVKRHALARIMGRWTQRCADDGFDAVEYDNLDSFGRSHHLLTRADNKAFARLLVKHAHAAGLAAAQKNWAEWDGTRAGFDFAVAEQCAQFSECSSYVDHYGSHVLAVEYRRKAFRASCRDWADRIAVVRRDVDLTKHGLRRWCA